jgi:hypothetical protein
MRARVPGVELGIDRGRLRLVEDDELALGHVGITLRVQVDTAASGAFTRDCTTASGFGGRRWNGLQVRADRATMNGSTR